MKQMLLSASLFAFLMSCGEANTADSTEETNIDSTQVSDDSIVDPEVVEETTTFEYFEDYAQIESKTALYEQFSADQLKDDERWYAEGTVKREVTILTNEENKITFVWAEEDNESLASIEANHLLYNENYEEVGSQTIKSITGVELGWSIKQLVEWNEAPIYFYGFGWDFGGGIVKSEEKGGKILSCETRMTLDMDWSDEKYNDISGDQEFNSDEDGIMDAPIFVSYFSYYPPSKEIAE